LSRLAGAVCYFGFVNIRFPKSGLVLALVLLALAIPAWLLLRPQPDTARHPTAAASQADAPTVTSELAVADPSGDVELPDTAPPAASHREPDHAVPPDASATTPPQAESAAATTAEQLAVLRDVESQISTALDGDQNAAIELGAFLNQCQFTFHDRHRVEQSIARGQRAYAEGKPVTQFRPSSPARQFETFPEFESSQWNTFFRCEAARKLVTEDFWASLQQQADAGNPVARYLFATLMRHDPSNILTFELWDEELAQRDQAREYTTRNLEDREPLGVLALAAAEAGIGLRFTGSGINTHSVLVLAAVKCGLATPDLLQAVDDLLQQVERMEKTKPGALERLNAASDEARQMFCK